MPEMPIIIFESDALLVLNKPAGLLIHSHPGSTEKTLVDWLLEHYPSMRNVGELESLLPTTDCRLPGNSRCGIVHRLDKDTSGVILVARTQKMYKFLKCQFSAGDPEVGYAKRPKKVYQALVYGIVKDDQGMINRPIGRSRTNPKLRRVGQRASSTLREALTYYKVLERFRLSSVESYTFLEVYPKTGRPHQVRVHLGSIGKPVVCDALYAPGKICPLFGLARQALHAASIEILLPDGQQRKFETPLPTDMKKALAALREARAFAPSPL